MIARIVGLGIVALAGTVVHAQAGRTLSCSAVIDAPVDEVWAAFTTEDGIESWMVPATEIDLRVGGEWRTSYNPDSTLRDEHTIVHTILSYEPGRMMSVRTTPAPAMEGLFAGVDFTQVWSVFRFEPVEGGTRVTVTGLGYGEGEAWDRVYGFFERNNPLVLEELGRHFGDEDGPRETGALSRDDQRVMDLLHRWVGGEWIHESRPATGGVFRVRNAITPGPDGVSLLCQGWLGGEDGMHPHSLAVIRRGVDGGVWFENVNEAGHVARGRITLEDEGAIRWEWNVTHLDGTTQRYSIETVFPEDRDAYTMKIARIAVDEGVETVTPMVEAGFTRVERAAEEFHRLAPEAAGSSDGE